MNKYQSVNVVLKNNIVKVVLKNNTAKIVLKNTLLNDRNKYEYLVKLN